MKTHAIAPVAIALAAVLAPTTQAQAVLNISHSTPNDTSTIGVGDPLTVNVDLSGVNQVDFLSFDLVYSPSTLFSYDGAILVASGTDSGDLFDFASPGQVSLTFDALVGGPITSDGTAFTIDLIRETGAAGSIAIQNVLAGVINPQTQQLEDLEVSVGERVTVDRIPSDDPTVIPEPMTGALGLIALTGAGIAATRRRR